MRIEVHWHGHLLFSAAAVDFAVLLPSWLPEERALVPFEERCYHREKIAAVFIEMVKHRISYLNIHDAEMYLFFDSRLNTKYYAAGD